MFMANALTNSHASGLPRIGRAASLVSFGMLMVIAMLSQGCSTAKQATFASPDLAVQNMVGALNPLDKERLEQIFGSKGDELVSSGDEVADQLAAARFLDGYNQKHELLTNPDGSRTLQIGENDWPFPVPIVESKGLWSFDTAQGLEEILNRRIGQNELHTIQVCLAIVDAQREYALLDPDGDGLNEYARKFLSDPSPSSGTQLRNGLYWETISEEPLSPLGLLVAEAAAEGYRRGESNMQVPYHGYYYRILTSQGPDAAGGTFEYIVDEHMMGGFAVVAWPASYGNSGVMTFITNHNGVLFQKDLGTDTARVGAAMTVFNPDPSWTAAP